MLKAATVPVWPAAKQGFLRRNGLLDGSCSDIDRAWVSRAPPGALVAGIVATAALRAEIGDQPLNHVAGLVLT